MKKIFLLVIINFFYCCKLQRSVSNDFDWQLNDTPPGTIKLKENFFFDQSEVRNLDYLEFLHWMARVFGSESKEYIEMLPDSTVWNELGMNYSRKYFAINSHQESVVGVSFKQIKAFCKWRSDRVMEFILIREGVLNYNPSLKENNYFTIEKYYTGKCLNLKPHPQIMYYPDYSLPDSNDFILVSKLADSLVNRLNNRKKQKLADFLLERCFENIPNKTDSLPYGIEPVKNMSMRKFWNSGVIINLKGNVRELTSDSTITFGASFIDSCSVLNGGSVFNEFTEPNCYTGFRCVCRYKKWRE